MAMRCKVLVMGLAGLTLGGCAQLQRVEGVFPAEQLPPPPSETRAAPPRSRQSAAPATPANPAAAPRGEGRTPLKVPGR
jgi:hypothetical protein